MRAPGQAVRWHMPLLCTTFLLASGVVTGAPAGHVVCRTAEPVIAVTLDPGQILLVHTAARPTTAYRWHVGIGGDQVAAIFVASRTRGASPDPLPGQGEASEFEFKAVTSGTAQFGFEYFAGPVYPGFDIADRFELRVIVR